MADNLTKIIITANAAQAEGALRGFSSSLDGLGRKVMNFSGLLGGLGGALSITAFAGFIKSSIDAADRLDELSQITGTSVEELAGLDYAAKQNGASLETVARGGQKLSAILSDKPELFKKLGISATDSTEAMIQLADIFATMPDGMEKSALAAKLFGDRLGGEMILFLNQGTAAMRANIAAGQEYNPVTAESARMAAEFNDNLDKLKAAAGGAGMAMTNNLLPQLTEISTAMALAAREGGLLKAAWVGLGGLGAALFTDEFDTAAQRATKKIVDLRGELGDLERHREQTLPGRGGLLQKWLYGTTEEIDAKIAATKKSIADLQEQLNKPVPPPKPGEKPADSGKGKSLLSALGGTSTTAKTDPNAAAILAIQNEEFRKQMELMGVAAEQTKVYELAMKGATKAQIEQAQAAADSIGALNAQIQGKKDLAKATEQAAKDKEKAQEETNDEIRRSALKAQAIIADTDPIYKAGLAWQDLTDLIEKGFITAEQAGQYYAQSFGESTDQMTEFAKRAGQNIQDAFADFLFDPFKGGVQGMLDGFTTMLRKMAAEALASQILGSIGAWGKAGGGAGSVIGDIAATVFGGKKAAGGPVSGGMTYLVGERGPELFTPSGGGNITPNDKLGGKSITVINNFTLSQPADRRTQEQIAAMAGASIQSAMMRGA